MGLASGPGVCLSLSPLKTERAVSVSGNIRSGLRVSEKSSATAVTRVRSWIVSVLPLLGAAAYAPGTLYADQSSLLSRGYRLLFIAAAAFVVLVLVVRLLVWLGARQRVAVGGVCGIWLLVTVTGDLPMYLRAPLVIGLLAVTLVVLARILEELGALSGVLIVFAIVTLVGPAAQLALTWLSRSQVADLPAVAVDVSTGSVASPRPDIYLLVLDGYPSQSTLRRFQADDPDAFEQHLASKGFHVIDDLRTAYSYTAGAIPSLLNGQYVFDPGVEIDSAQRVAAGQVIGGDSVIVATLKSIGYEFTMIENGWHLSKCGPAVDRCVESHFYDEMLSMLLVRSALSSFSDGELWRAATYGTLHTFDSLMSLTVDLAENETPDLVLAHALAPHPPLLLDESCQWHQGGIGRSGGSLTISNIDEATMGVRIANFLSQVECVNRLTEGFIDVAPPDAVIMILGDHGPDSLGQLALPAAQWTKSMVAERMYTFGAFRIPACTPEISNVVQVVPAMLGCLGFEVHGPAPHEGYLISKEGDRHVTMSIPLGDTTD